MPPATPVLHHCPPSIPHRLCGWALGSHPSIPPVATSTGIPVARPCPSRLVESIGTRLSPWGREAGAGAVGCPDGVPYGGGRGDGAESTHGEPAGGAGRTHRRVTLPFWGSWAGRTGQGSPQKLNEDSAKSCPWGGATPGSGSCWRAAPRRAWEVRGARERHTGDEQDIGGILSVCRNPFFGGAQRQDQERWAQTGARRLPLTTPVPGGGRSPAAGRLWGLPRGVSPVGVFKTHLDVVLG